MRWRIVAAAVLVFSACSSSATTVGGVGDSSTEPVATSTPTEDVRADEAEPSNDDPSRPTAVVPTPAATPVPPPPPPAVPVTFDNLLGFTPDGAFAYETLGTPWENPRACDSDPAETLVGVDVARSTDDDPALRTEATSRSVAAPAA